MSLIITFLFFVCSDSCRLQGRTGNEKKNGNEKKKGKKKKKSPAACSFLCPAPAPAPRTWLHRTYRSERERGCLGVPPVFLVSKTWPPPFRSFSLQPRLPLVFFWPSESSCFVYFVRRCGVASGEGKGEAHLGSCDSSPEGCRFSCLFIKTQGAGGQTDRQAFYSGVLADCFRKLILGCPSKSCQDVAVLGIRCPGWAGPGLSWPVPSSFSLPWLGCRSVLVVYFR